PPSASRGRSGRRASTTKSTSAAGSRGRPFRGRTEPMAEPKPSYVTLLADLLAALPPDLGWAFPTPAEYKEFLIVNARINSTPKTEENCKALLADALRVIPVDMARAFTRPAQVQAYAVARAAAAKMLPNAA